METFLWIVQGVLALKMLSAAYTHGLRQGIDSMGPTAKPVLAASALLMVLGSLGLVGPILSGIPAWMVPVAAAGLAALQLLSIIFHLRCREDPKVFVAVVLFALAALVAVGRRTVSPL